MGFFDYEDNSSDASDELTVFNGLTDEDWQQLAQYTTNTLFTAGELIIKAGEEGDGVYILVSGRVEVLKKGAFGSIKSIAEIDEGSIFGELAFFDHQPRSAAIKAMSDGSVIHMTKAGFDQLASWNPTLARTILFDLGRVLAYRFRRSLVST